MMSRSSCCFNPVSFDRRSDSLAEIGVETRKLIRNGGEDEGRVSEFRFAPPREEELPPEQPLILGEFGNRTCDGGLANTGDSLHPKEARKCEVWVDDPLEDRFEEVSSGPFEAAGWLVWSLAVEASVLCARK